MQFLAYKYSSSSTTANVLWVISPEPSLSFALPPPSWSNNLAATISNPPSSSTLHSLLIPVTGNCSKHKANRSDEIDLLLAKVLAKALSNKWDQNEHQKTVKASDELFGNSLIGIFDRLTDRAEKSNRMARTEIMQVLAKHEFSEEQVPIIL